MDIQPRHRTDASLYLLLLPIRRPYLLLEPFGDDRPSELHRRRQQAVVRRPLFRSENNALKHLGLLQPRLLSHRLQISEDEFCDFGILGPVFR